MPQQSGDYVWASGALEIEIKRLVGSRAALGDSIVHQRCRAESGLMCSGRYRSVHVLQGGRI